MGTRKGGRSIAVQRSWAYKLLLGALINISLKHAGAATTCQLTVVGTGAAGTIKSASLSCKGDPITVDPSASPLLRPFAASFSGVKLAANGTCGARACMLSVCGDPVVTFADSSVSNVFAPGVVNGLCFGGKSKATLLDSEFTTNTFMNGSVAGTDSTTVTFHGTRVIGNQGTFDINVEGSFGGGANFDARATAIVTAGSLFADNYANRAGAMMVSSDATVIINGNSVFRNNTATMTDYGRGGIGGAIDGEDRCKLVISGNTTFVSNTATVGAAIGLGYSDGCTATVTETNFVENKVVTHHGGAIWVQGPHTVTVAKSKFLRNFARAVPGTGDPDLGSGGAIFSQMNGTVTVVDSVFLDNWSSLAGGAIRARGSTLSVARCTFERNQALTQGGGAVACQGSNCTLSSCSFKDHVTSGNGGVLLANNDAFRVVMQDCELTNSSATAGGAIYAELPYSTASLYVLTLNNTNVTHNTASWGGGLDLTAGGNITIANTRIMNNHGTIGGGIAYLSSCRKLNVSCADFLNIAATSVIANNSAQQGGGLYVENSDDVNIDFMLTSSVTDDNTAFVGPDLAITPTKTSFLLGAAPSFPEFASRSARDSGLLPFSVLVSNRGGVGIASVRIQASVEPADGTTLTGNAHTSDGDGVADFSDLKLRAPAGDYKIVLTATDYPALPPLSFPISVRACRLGEVNSPQFDTCEPCGASYYSLNPKNTTCDVCLPNAQCPGGSVIAPNIGYWHSAANSTQLHTCPNPMACLGPRSSLYACVSDGHDANATNAASGELGVHQLCSSVGAVDRQCTEGYTGSVCGKCAREPVRYGMKTPFNCGACLPASTTIALFTIAFIALLLLMAVTVQSNWTDNQHPKTATDASDVLKILIRYIQYTVIIGSLHISWPETLSVPFKALSWLYASGSSQAVSLDCAFEDDPDLPLPMKHMLVFIVVPVVALAVLLLVQAGMWGWARLRQTSTPNLAFWLRERLPVVFLVTVFYFFPALVRVGLGMFACYTVDEPSMGQFPQNAVALGSYWVYDMDMQCWEGLHYSWAMGVGITFTLLFCLAVPVGIAAFMIANKKRVDDPGFRRHFGFLYCNYRPKFCYYEAFASVQTAALVAVDVFGYVVGLYYTVLLLTTVMVIIIVAQAICKPFAFARVHRLQLLVNGCVCLTAFVSLSFFSFDRQPGRIYKETMGALVLAANVACVALMCCACVTLLWTSPKSQLVRRKLSKSFSGISSTLTRMRSAGRDSDQGTPTCADAAASSSGTSDGAGDEQGKDVGGKGMNSKDVMMGGKDVMAGGIGKGGLGVGHGQVELVDVVVGGDKDVDVVPPQKAGGEAGPGA